MDAAATGTACAIRYKPESRLSQSYSYHTAMANEPVLDVALIGLGWWGRIIADHIRSSSKLRLVRVSDINEEAARFAAERDIPFSSRLEEVLADPRVRGVVICTPHSQHADQIVAAAQAG